MWVIPPYRMGGVFLVSTQILPFENISQTRTLIYKLNNTIWEIRAFIYLYTIVWCLQTDLSKNAFTPVTGR